MPNTIIHIKRVHESVLVHVWRSDFVKLIRACFRLFKSYLPYFKTLGRDVTVFDTDPFIYFIRLVAMDRTYASPIFEYLIFQ